MTKSVPVICLLGSAMLGGCTVGPDYTAPKMDIPAGFKEAADGWKPGTPQDMSERGPWWSVYQDPVLDGLERQVEISNQTLKASEAAFRQADAVVRAAQAGLWPSLDLNGSETRAQTAASSSSGQRLTRTTYSAGLSASWDLDIWGKIRRTVESDTALAQASADDLAAAKLSAQSTLAISYFQLRAADELKRLLDRSAEAYAQSLRIAQNQYAAGFAGRADVVQAQTQLRSTQAQAINAGLQRAQLEHAIAVLTGQAPATFHLDPADMPQAVPVTPVLVPSTLLERRPDIAGAERRVAAANAQIGVAMAAFYPDLSLSAALTYSGTAASGLFSAANRVWSLGPKLSQSLFDAGLREAQTDEARAAWDKSTATYRQTVLTAFQQVEDQLAALDILQRQAAIQSEAVQSAHEAERLMLNQYRAGTVAYTNVVSVQTATLSNEQTALTILQNRLVASVGLIQSLGGGWQVPSQP